MGKIRFHKSTIEQDIADFKKELLAELDQEPVSVRDKVIALLKSLSPRRPSYSIVAGMFAKVRKPPYATKNYYKRHHCKKIGDKRYEIWNDAHVKRKDEKGNTYKFYTFRLVEFGWKRSDGTKTPGYHVYSQAIYILKSDPEFKNYQFSVKTSFGTHFT